MILIYDGQCPFCTKLASGLQKRSLQPIEIISYHYLTEENLQNIHSQLTKTKCEGDVQFIQNGIRYPGFFGVRALLWNVKFYRYFVWLLYLPLVPFLGMLAFVFLKKIRYSFD
ncbi:DCC1-like thiol-disulfide oxidoreductase family protein [Leptospira sp. WS39.C2]